MAAQAKSINRGSSPGRPKGRTSSSSAYHHGDLRQALKEVALEVLAGPDAHLLSFRELARRLGVTTAAPYHHFKDRADLLVSLAIDGFHCLHASMSQTAEAAGRDDSVVEKLTLAYLDFAYEQRGYYCAMFLPEVCALRDVPELRAAADLSFDYVCRAILHFHPQLAEQEVSERAVSLWSFLHGVVTLRAAGPLGRRLPQEREREFAVEGVWALLRLPE
ncbi:MAG: TetR/AcrR family transcriptional regulator [Acidobacteriaceae bacterium]|nr:TetR/AcrR family transcriptional regulator [Acidobacteriaceae bacterium]